MMFGKYAIFALGITAGVVAVYGMNYLPGQQLATDSTPPPSSEIQQQATPESPFSVVDESPLATVALAASVNDEFQSPDTDELLQRIEDAESRIAELESEMAEIRVQQVLPVEIPNDTSQEDLLSSVFEPVTVTEIQSIRSDLQLQRLELRDAAIREGWINTDRFREESRALRSGSQLRETLGDEDYDKLLVAEGRNNRVSVESIIENSAADISGLQIGDVIIRYADDRVFQFRDLQDGTTGGQRNETVTMQVSRNDELIDLVIPRGPMGVTLNGVSQPPIP